MENVTTVPSKFIERAEIINLLVKRVNAMKKHYRQNIAIIGHQSLGKTTLIFDLLRRCKGNEIIPIYIDIKPNSFESFVKNFIGVLLYQYLSSENLSVEDNLEFLIASSKEKIPITTRAIIKINKLLKDNSNNNEVYLNLLELPQILFDETKKILLLILDEFHTLDSLGLDNPYFELSNKIMVQKHTMYIVISSAICIAQNILAEKLSLLFGNFEIIRLEPFDNNTAREFIKAKLQDLNIQENFRNFLVYFTGGYPFYLDVITERIKCTCLDNNVKNVSEKILLCGLTETMHKDHGILNQFFNNKYLKFQDENHSTLTTNIILAIANGIKKPSQISSLANKKTQEINKCLNKLIQMDIVTKKGVFNYINDPLFVHWLKFVLQQKQNSFNTDVRFAVSQFESDIKQLLDDFIIESKKEIGQRLKELFERFENDIVELDRKRFMLTHFDEIIIKDINGASILNARRAKKYWLCYIEKNYIDETKIEEFLANINQRKREYIRRILIALNGLDVNARLKALEARVWIWDENILNEFLSIFEKPRFIK